MMTIKQVFLDDFLWGGATAANQYGWLIIMRMKKW